MVRTLASGISAGSELLALRGQIPAGLELDLPTLDGTFALPLKYGYASVGRVEELGEAVSELHPGQLVFVHHPHQDSYLVPARLAIPLPAGLAPEVGVLLANLETAVTAILDARPRLGDRAVIFGQGVVGLLLLLLLRRCGAASVTTVDPEPVRRTLSVQLGADSSLAPGPELPGLVQAATGGMGADLVLDASGSPEALDLAIACAGFQATVCVVSWFGAKAVPLHLGEAFHRGRLRLLATQVSRLDPALTERWDRQRRLELCLQLLRELPLDRLVSHRVPLARAARAYQLLQENPAQAIQVVLTYGGDGV